MHRKTIMYEWAADHFKWVQYPRTMQNQINNATPSLQFGTRLSLFVIGFAAVAIGVPTLLLLGFIVIPSFF